MVPESALLILTLDYSLQIRGFRRKSCVNLIFVPHLFAASGLVSHEQHAVRVPIENPVGRMRGFLGRHLFLPRSQVDRGDTNPACIHSPALIERLVGELLAEVEPFSPGG